MVDVKWLTTCATAGEFLYGYYTIDVLRKMYESKEGCTITVPDLLSEMKELEKTGTVLMQYMEGRLDDTDDGQGFFVPLVCEGTPLEKVMKQADADGNPYASLHLDENERQDLVAGVPGGLEYYIPTAAEIGQLVEEGYIRTPAMTKLEEEIIKRGGDPAFLTGVWQKVSTDKLDMMEAINAVFSGAYPKAAGMNEGEDVPEELIPSIPSMDDLNSLMPLINEFLNNVNLRNRKGWRPNELFRKMHPNGLTGMPTIMPGSVHAAKTFKEAEPQLRAMGARVDYSSIDNFATVGKFGERRVTKVGRNDPCPCGSGLKYKRCHGRNR